jgi:hypothetical protein
VVYLSVTGGYEGSWCYTALLNFYLTLYVRMVITIRGVSAITVSLQSFVSLLEPQQ